MKLGAVAVGITLLGLMLLAGCPKSNPMLDHSKTAGAVQQKPGTDTPGGELTTGSAPSGGTAAPAAGGDAGSASSGGGD